MKQAIVGATLISGTGAAPLQDAAIVVDGGRLTSVGSRGETVVPEDAEVVDAQGRFVIPGLMDANVHLCAAVTPDFALEFEGRYADLVEEAAQVTLSAGVTTVFDTWGPLAALTEVRDRINSGQTTGSRMFIGGNIIGFGGPLADDFFDVGEKFATATKSRVNEYWEQGVGPDLMWFAAEDVRARVRAYVERSNIDFIKYAGSGHTRMEFIQFSEATQRAIVEEAHRAGLTAQAHTTNPESLRMEIEAGADLLQHGDMTGLQEMPESTLRDIVDRQLPVAALLLTERYLKNDKSSLKAFNEVKDKNDRRLIDAGARLLLTTDGFVLGPKIYDHPAWGAPMKDVLDLPTSLGESHFIWLEAAIERGMEPMEALLSGTRYVAEAYGQGHEIGSLESGKKADLVILQDDPLADPKNYRLITHVMKDGVMVDRDSLPAAPIITQRSDH